MQAVVTLGEAMVLLAAAETGALAQVKHFTKHTAGAETNVAVGLARLPLSANILFTTVMATKMPFVGRG